MESDLSAAFWKGGGGGAVEAEGVLLRAERQGERAQGALVGGGADGAGELHQCGDGGCARHVAARGSEVGGGAGDGAVGVQGGSEPVAVGAPERGS